MKQRNMKTFGLTILGMAFFMGSSATAQERVTFKSAKTSSSYYQMGVQLSEAIQSATDGALDITVEESQGSVQNVMEVRARGADYVFLAAAPLVTAAREGTGAFEARPSPKFATIRTLFPLPALTMHFVASQELNVETFSDLAGAKILLGKGSFGATEGMRYIELFGLEGKVEIADVELSNAVSAFKNGRINAFVTAGSWPAPNVIEAGASVPLTLVSLTPEQIEQTGRSTTVIPTGTYPGQTSDVVTTSLPVITYTTTAMSDDTAYALTKAFWEEKAAMGEDASWWTGVTTDVLDQVQAEFHPGAVRYYEEVGIDVPTFSAD